MSWLKKLLGRDGDDEQPKRQAPAPPPKVEAPPLMSPKEVAEELDWMAEEAFAARDAVYGSLGEMIPQVLTHIMSPALMGGPRWPLGQAWRVIHRPHSTIVASHGLTDPFEDLTPLGFQVEVCAETPGRISQREIMGHWMTDTVMQVSQYVAADPGWIHESLQHFGSASTLVQVEEAPAEALNEQGMMGLVIGFPTPEIPSEMELPGGKVRLLVLKTLFASELAWLESHEDIDRARTTLIERLLRQPNPHLCTFDREPVA